MKLIKLTKLLPLRDENRKIYKWEEAPVWLHPWNLQALTWVDEVKLWGAVLTNGNTTFIKETPEQVNKMLAEAS